MTGPEMEGRGPALRWGTALAVVLALHAGLVILLVDRGVAPPVTPPAPEAIMLDLAPDLPPLQPAIATVPVPAAVPPPTSLAAPPPPVPLAPEPPMPPDIPPLEPPPPVPAEAVLPTPPPPPRAQPKPKPRPAPRRIERVQAPPQEDTRPVQPLPQAAAPVPTGPVPTGPAQPTSRPPAPPSNAVPTWRSALLGRLQAAKRYPDLARSRGDQGVATVTFTMSRSGRVLQVALVRSSGSPLLDEEAVALVRRAEPLPQVPDDIAGAAVTLTVPISFALR